MKAKKAVAGQQQDSGFGEFIRRYFERRADSGVLDFINSIPDAVVVVDAQGCIAFVNSQAVKFFGYDWSELVGNPVEILLPDILRERHSVLRRRYLEDDPKPRMMGHGLDLRARRKDGSLLPIDLSLNPLKLKHEVFVIAAVRDMSEQVRARQELAESERLFRSVMEGAPQGMAIVGMDLKFSRVNPTLCAMLGRDEAWLLTHTVADVVHPDDLESDLAGREALLSGAVASQVRERRCLRGDGSTVWVVHSTALLRDEHQKPLCYVSHIQDNSDQHELVEGLSFRAAHDALTGLTNRDQLEERVAEVCSREPRREGTTGALFCDLDHFARVNDTYGHAAGDKLLQVVAQRLEAVVRAGDIVARMGGDEFVVVLANVYDLSAAAAVAEKLRAAISEPILIEDGQLIKITISVGIALAGPGIEPHRLLRNADAALYEAKHSGRDRIAVFNAGEADDLAPR